MKCEHENVNQNTQKQKILPAEIVIGIFGEPHFPNNVSVVKPQDNLERNVPIRAFWLISP